MALDDCGLLWSEARAEFINQQLATLVQKEKITFTFVVSPITKALNYFSESLDTELAQYSPDPFVYIAPSSSRACEVDLVLHISNGRSGDAVRLWNSRQNEYKNAMCAVWLWDNHVWGMGNQQVSASVDLVFASHGYVTDYLVGPASLLAGHTPPCSAQWTIGEAQHFFREHAAGKRNHKLLFNYVDYGNDYPERKRILDALVSGLSLIDNLSMTRNDKSRYFEMSREAKFLEWMAYKATVIVPVVRDLSTRVFDALLAGLILIVPDSVLDFDLVVPPSDHELLGIIRIPDLEVETVKAVEKIALDRFDMMGEEGALLRHRYALENHMLVNRVTSMLETVWRIGSGEFQAVFGNIHDSIGLYLKRDFSNR